MTSTAASKGLQSPVVVEEEVSDILSSLSIAGASGVTRMTSDTGFKDTVNQLTETLRSFKSSSDDTLKELKRLNMKMDKERFHYAHEICHKICGLRGTHLLLLLTRISGR